MVVAKKVVTKKKMSKEELREDKVLTALQRLVEYSQENLRFILGAVALVVLITVGIGLWNQSRTRAEQSASLAMNQAQQLYFAGNYGAALAQFQGVQSQFSSAPSARNVGLYIGSCQLSLGNPVEAEKAFQDLLRKVGKDPLLKSAAVRGLAGALVDAGKPADAGARYREAAGIEGNLMAADDWMGAGSAFAAASDWENAKQAYQKVIADFSDSPRLADAKVRLAELSVR